MKFVPTLQLSFRYSVLTFVHQSTFKWLIKIPYIIKVNQPRISPNDFMINILTSLLPNGLRGYLQNRKLLGSNARYWYPTVLQGSWNLRVKSKIKNAVTNIGFVRLSFQQWSKPGHGAAQQQIKRFYKKWILIRGGSGCCWIPIPIFTLFQNSSNGFIYYSIRFHLVKIEVLRDEQRGNVIQQRCYENKSHNETLVLLKVFLSFLFHLTHIISKPENGSKFNPLWHLALLTHFRPMFHLCRNQVVGFYLLNI